MMANPTPVPLSNDAVGSLLNLLAAVADPEKVQVQIDAWGAAQKVAEAAQEAATEAKTGLADRETAVGLRELSVFNREAANFDHEGRLNEREYAVTKREDELEQAKTAIASDIEKRRLELAGWSDRLGEQEAAAVDAQKKADLLAREAAEAKKSHEDALARLKKLVEG